MSLYENKSCPVCNREFIDGDDIVVCPDCGTPHHRECYSLIGHCVNKGLHSSNYDYNAETKPVIEKKEDIGEEEKNEQSGFSPLMGVLIEPIPQHKEDEGKTIDGVSIREISATVRQNAPYYVKKFNELSLKNKKTSWNWSAFIFGSFYLLHRKMYRLGIAFYALSMAVFYSASALIYKVAPEFMKASAQIAEIAAQKLTPSNEQLNSLMNCADTGKAAMVVYGMLGVILIFHIIIGVIANSCYKTQVFNIIKNVSEQLDNGASFTSSSFMMGGEMNMTQEQMKDMYLARKGGTSFMAPALALFLLSIIIY